MTTSLPDSASPERQGLLRHDRPPLRDDLVAGLTAAAVVVPQAMAYAAIAGLPLAIGLYTALVPPCVYAALGTSRPLSVTTTSTLAILTAAALHQAVPGGDAAALTAAAATLAALVGAVLLLACCLRLGMVASFISEPVLVGFKAGIGVVVPCAGMIKVGEFRAIARVRSMEFSWALASAAGVVALGTLRGILVAVVLSMLALIHHANRRPVFVLARKPGTDVYRPLSPEHPGDETFPGLLILKTEGIIHFANVQRVVELVWRLIEQHRPRVLVLDCSAIPDFEYTALKMLTEVEQKLREAGVTLWLAALNPEPLQLIQHSPLGATLGRARMHFNVEQAVRKYLATAAAEPVPAS